jgi:dTMP kinase
MTGKTIVFEGIDGSGKSTMSLRLKNHLGDTAIHTKHPGATILGQKIRHLVKHDPEVTIDRYTEQILMLADLTSFTNQIHKPALEEGKIVICDRSNLIGGLAYGYAAGKLDSRFLELQKMIETPRIDLLIIYLCKWEIAKKRIQTRATLDKIESRGDTYFEAVSNAYTEISRPLSTLWDNALHLMRNWERPHSIQFIDAEQSEEKVWEDTLKLKYDI